MILTALMAIRGKDTDDETLRGIKRDLYFEMKRRRMAKYTRAGIYDFLKYYVSFEDSGQFSIFEEETREIEGRSTEIMGTREYLLDKAERKGIEQGIERERARAEAEKLAEKLKSALEFKKMGVPATDIARGLGLDVEQVEKL